MGNMIEKNAVEVGVAVGEEEARVRIISSRLSFPITPREGRVLLLLRGSQHFHLRRKEEELTGKLNLPKGHVKRCVRRLNKAFAEHCGIDQIIKTQFGYTLSEHVQIIKMEAWKAGGDA